MCKITYIYEMEEEITKLFTWFSRSIGKMDSEKRSSDYYNVNVLILLI